MAALTDIYVDPSLNSNTGAGTIGDPYGDLQWALTTHTRDATHGNQINIKDAAAENLAAVLDFATNWGAPTAIVPTVIRGYRTTKNDGYKAIIDGGGGACIPSTTGHLHFRDIEFQNGGAATIINSGQGVSLINCKISGTSGRGILTASSYFHMSGCEITDCDVGLEVASSAVVVTSNYFKFGPNRNFSTAVIHNFAGLNVYERNIISVGTSGVGISVQGQRSRINGNSILAAGSTGSGIEFSSAVRGQEATVTNNVVEGFSGVTTGSGFNFLTATAVPLRYAGNAAFGNTENYRNPGDIGIADNEDNEVLTASPFAKTGDDNFANRFAYFAPTTEGNIRGGAIQ